MGDAQEETVGAPCVKSLTPPVRGRSSGCRTEFESSKCCQRAPRRRGVTTVHWSEGSVFTHEESLSSNPRGGSRNRRPTSRSTSRGSRDGKARGFVGSDVERDWHICRVWTEGMKAGKVIYSDNSELDGVGGVEGVVVRSKARSTDRSVAGIRIQKAIRQQQRYDSVRCVRSDASGEQECRNVGQRYRRTTSSLPESPRAPGRLRTNLPAFGQVLPVNPWPDLLR